MPIDDNKEQVSPDAEPTTETTPEVTEETIEPVVEEKTPDVITPDAEPVIQVQSPETDEELPLIEVPEENPDLYTIEAADLNVYPELSQQGAQLHDQVVYGSLWINEWATAAKESYVKSPWPRNTSAVKNPITFKQQG